MERDFYAEIINCHFDEYPQMQLQDLYKLGIKVLLEMAMLFRAKLQLWLDFRENCAILTRKILMTWIRISPRKRKVVFLQFIIRRHIESCIDLRIVLYQ